MCVFTCVSVYIYELMYGYMYVCVLMYECTLVCMYT